MNISSGLKNTARAKPPQGPRTENGTDSEGDPKPRKAKSRAKQKMKASAHSHPRAESSEKSSSDEDNTSSKDEDSTSSEHEDNARTIVDGEDYTFPHPQTIVDDIGALQDWVTRTYSSGHQHLRGQVHKELRGQMIPVCFVLFYFIETAFHSKIQTPYTKRKFYAWQYCSAGNSLKLERRCFDLNVRRDKESRVRGSILALNLLTIIHSPGDPSFEISA